MKKLFAVLFCTLVMSGAAFADEPSYEIDPVATVKAPWKVGDEIIKGGHCQGVAYYREFLGMTQSGFALMQDFYLSGEKFSSPYLMTVDTEKNMGGGCPIGIEGRYTQWYKNGQKQSETNYINGKAEGLATLWYIHGQKHLEANHKNDKLEGRMTVWYENGQKESEGNFKNGKADGTATQWYENGQKQSEINFKEDELNDGLVSWWYENGQKQSETNVENGKEVSSRMWDEHGNLIGG